MITRRSFFKNLFFVSAMTAVISSCVSKVKNIILRWTIPNQSLGHRLLSMDFPKPTFTQKVEIIIVGGGISGLTAGYWLLKHGISNFKILELEKQPGGNSRYLTHTISDSPLGAHYLPLPNTDDKKLIDFLEDINIVLGFDKDGLPVFDEQYLSFDMKERLFIYNKWQDDIIPKSQLNKEDESEINSFYHYVNKLKEEKDENGKYYFDIPINKTSKSQKYRTLDKMTFSQWFNQQNYKSEILKKHIDYSFRDDYGLGVDEVSAWAGLQYFAGRKSRLNEKYTDAVLTSPKGNGFLVDALESKLKDHIISQNLVFNIETQGNQVLTKVYNNIQKNAYEIQSRFAIVATPQYVNHRILPKRVWQTNFFYYNPWVVATIILNPNEEINRYQLAWDNVIFEGKGLGYIYNQHQYDLNPNKISITYYYTLDEIPQAKRRKFAYSQTQQYWEDLIIKDLERAHNKIADDIEEININIWGHGMISPRPNFIFNPTLDRYKADIENRVFFAHTDLSGISIFEEAFHQGIDAAENILKVLKN